MQLRIHEGFHGVGNVFRGKWGAVREMQAAAQMKRDGAAFRRNFPGNGEPGFEGLGLAIQANQNAAS